VTYTIVLSGPKTAESQARTALASAGYTPHPTSHDHGLPSTVTGKKVRQAVSFLSVSADDVDGPPAAVASLGYVLRLHHEESPPPEPSVESQLAATLADMQREIAELKAKVGDR
jgi:hypothetical protein